MYVLASGPGGPRGVGWSHRPLVESPGLLFSSNRSLFRRWGERTAVSDPTPSSRTGGGWLSAFRRIGHRVKAPVAPVPPSPVTGGVPDHPVPPPAREVAPAPAAAPPSPGLPTAGSRGPSPGNCPRCQVPYLPAGSAGRWGCPLCGRHAVLPAGTDRTVPSVPAPSSPSATTTRQEELLAAWVIGRPVPCPRCRTPLKRVAMGQLACPSCGNRTEIPELSGPPSRGEAGRPEERAVVDRASHPLNVGAERTVGRERGH